MSQTSASFPTTSPGFAATPIPLTLVNVGNATANIVLGAPLDPQFTLSPPVGGSLTTQLAPGAQLTVTAGFTPRVGATPTPASSSTISMTGDTCGTDLATILERATGRSVADRSTRLRSVDCGGAPRTPFP